MKLFKYKALILLIPILFAASCGSGGIYYPGKKKTVNVPPPKTEKPAKKEPVKKVKVDTNAENVFNAPFIDVWLAAIESTKWIKWNIAFIDEREGVIRLKEAYAYRKGGKLLRTYAWPTKENLQTSSINDYLEKVGRYNPGQSNTVFTQENLKMTVTKVSADVTKVDIDYTIRPYTFSGKIGYQIDSNGFIESLMLERIKENLDRSPVAKR
ncbi:MAG: hypothetical protein DHS20C13_19780 [Thermodesulfobacteriota bacterium]|nr:MAG: hypothetical protein DHS20C13_19780 [Thermodesulfobacteriota bacterium]